MERPCAYLFCFKFPALTFPRFQCCEAATRKKLFQRFCANNSRNVISTTNYTKKMFYLRKNATFFASFLSDFTHLAEKIVHKKIRLVSSNRGNVCFSVGSSEKNETTIGALFEHWRHKFEIEAISEPVASTEHIVAHVLGTTRVTTSKINNFY